ncbi:MAG: dTMP kinase [Candidatus Micrarchaeota archaeon]
MVLVVLEGIDASGKKTQTELLARRLRKTGKKVAFLHFPSYGTPSGKLVEAYLKGEFGPREKVPRKFAAMLYALDRFAQKKKLEGLLKKGFVVILDRYTQSNLAYASADLTGKERKELISWIEKLEKSLPKADAVVFLDVPPQQSEKLFGKRKAKIKGVRRDIHERDFSYAKRVYANYLSLAREKKWIVVKCVGRGRLKAKEAIAGEVYEALRRRKAL